MRIAESQTLLLNNINPQYEATIGGKEFWDAPNLLFL